MSRKSERAIARRRWNWLMIGFAAVGLVFAAFGVTMARSDGEAWDRAMDEQRYLDARCTVERVEVTEVQRSEDTRGARVVVTMTVHAAGGDRAGVAYEYPDYAWDPVSAARATTHELARGARIPCAYDPRDPARAVALRKARPAGPRPTLADSWLAFAFAGLFLLAPIAELFLPASVKAKRTYESRDP